MIYLSETLFGCKKLDEEETRLPQTVILLISERIDYGCIDVTPCTWLLGARGEELLMFSRGVLDNERWIISHFLVTIYSLIRPIRKIRWHLTYQH